MIEMLVRWQATALRRLGSNLRYTLGFGVIGALTGGLNQVPFWIDRINESGVGHFMAGLPRDVDGTLTAALLLTLLFRLSMERPADLLRRPRRFMMLLATGAAIATAVAWSIHMAINDWGIAFFSRPDKLFEFWTTTMLWGGLIGWLYLLSLQRVEDRAHLAGLLGRRAALGRQLARARLGTARAQVDPAMVAKVLSEVRIEYRSDPAAASARLDALISQLRRALNRVRNDDQTLESQS